MTPLQLATAFALAGSLVSAVVPTFVRNLRASRFAEPIDGLRHIAGRATLLAAGAPVELAYPESVGVTPLKVPAKERVLDAPGTWDAPTWRMLDFRLEREHSYSFEFESHHSNEAANFTARAYGDLDGDGQLSLFSIAGDVKAGKEPAVYALQLTREIE